MNSHDNQNLASGYTRYKFAIKEQAEEAKSILEEIFPTMKMKVSGNGALFCHTNGSLIFKLMISAKVNALGGAGA